MFKKLIPILLLMCLMGHVNAQTSFYSPGTVQVTDGTNTLGTPSHPIKTDPTGTTTQPVSGTFWPYTLGQQLASVSVPVVLTAAQLTTLTPPSNTGFALDSSLQSILTAVNKIPSQGQALAASSLPVVLTASQLTTLTPPAAITGFALEAGHLATIDTNTALNSTAANQTNIQANAGSDSTKAIAVQGITGGKAVKVDGSAVTQPVGGNVASGSSDSGNPVKIGGVYNTSLPTLTNGQRGDSQLDTNGRVITYLGTLLAGEDITNNVEAVIQKPITGATYSYSYDVAFGTAVTHNSKGSAGQLFSVTCTNINAAVRYLQFFNSTSSTAGTPVFSFPIAAGTSTAPATITLENTFFGVNGAYFSTGITWGISTTQATYTGATASDHNINLAYQ